jgi:hypothetical protein
MPESPGDVGAACLERAGVNRIAGDVTGVESVRAAAPPPARKIANQFAPICTKC